MLRRIEIENFRCIESARLELSPRATAVVGPNASGKTSLLEAIYFLGHGRSFRTTQRDKLLRAQAGFFRIVARLQATADADSSATSARLLASGSNAQFKRDRVAGVEYAGGATRVHLDGQAVASLAEMAAAVPIQVIDPGVHRLIEEGSARRRRLMDWGVFHVEQEFLHYWRRYQRALQQRNAALRAGQPPSSVAAWEGELVGAGAVVDRFRAAYTQRLEPHFQRLAERMVGQQVSFRYRRGWAADVHLEEALRDARPRDLRVRTTHVGPHRADLSFVVEEAAARDRVSRGQQKMLAAAFVLSQLSLRTELGAPPACLMLDDPAAELDVDNLGKLLAVVSETRAQLIVTSVHERGLEGLEIERMFHVEQGRFAPMV